MKFEARILLTLLLPFTIYSLKGQNIYQKLNDLPETIEVRAPEFNTEKKYFFKIDPIKNSLVIQDIRKSKDGNFHFYQFLYEIPLNELNSDSFIVHKDFDEISIEIRSAANKNSIISYMFQEAKVSSIQASNSILLGNWTYSDNLFGEIQQIIKTISEALPKVDSSVSQAKRIPGKFKFISENVMQVNANMDEDLRIWNDYYFAQIINEYGQHLYPKIVKHVKSALKEQNIDSQYPLPIMIYANQDGVIESIVIINMPADSYCEIDAAKLNPIRIDNIKKQPTKYVFLLE